MTSPAALITLPSGFWFDHRHCRQVRLRPVAAADEALALQAEAGLPPARRATTLLARCVEPVDGPVVEPLELARSFTVGDREALLLHLRRQLLGDELDCLARCPSPGCDQPTSLGLRVSDLLLPPYPAPQPNYDLEVPFGGAYYRVRFRLPTGLDLEAATDAAREDPEAAVGVLVRNCLENVRPAPEPGSDSSLLSAIAVLLSGALVERDPQAELELELTCPACGTAFSTVFDTATYLLQELDQEADGLQREIETLAFHYHWAERDILGMGPVRRRRYLDLLSERLAAQAAP